jgi:cell division protease FtsH
MSLGVIEENGYRTWGHAKRMLSDLDGINQGPIVDAEHLGKIKAYLCLAQLLKWMCGKYVRDFKKESNKIHVDMVLSSFNNSFFTLLWNDLPSMVGAKSAAALSDCIVASATDIKKGNKAKETMEVFRQMETSGMPMWDMPDNLSSAQALIMEAFWAEQFFDMDINVLVDILSTTTHYLKEVVDRAEASGLRSPLAVNLGRISQRFTPIVEDTRGVEWMIALSGLLGNMNCRDKFISVVKSVCPNKWEEFLCECEQAAGLPFGSMVNHIMRNGWLDKIGLVSYMDYQTHSWIEDKTRLINTASQEALEDFYPQEAGLFEALSWSRTSSLSTDNALPLEAFSYLGQDVVNLSAFAKSETPMRALLVGEGACGKTALALSAIKSANRKVILPREGATDYTGGWVCEVLRNLQRQAHMNGGALILLDPADKLLASSATNENPIPGMLQSAVEREKMQTSEIWAIQSLKDIDPQILHSFDLIIRLGPMPLASRIELAKTHFQEPGLAVQVAQACSTPGEIQSLANWKSATGISDWPALSSRLTGIQQAILRSKETAGELPVSVHPPRVGHKGFDDVVGQANVVRQARRIITGLRDPERYKALRAKAPKGILLTGGPGTGKTHLARAMAGEAGVPLLLADSAAMAREPSLIAAVFAEARRQSPCLLFLDELDAIGTTAKGAMGASPDPQRQAILNRLLTELDGFEGLEGVMVVGATHRSDLLDSALVRSGRLGLHLHLDDPTRQAREDLWRYYAAQVNCADTLHWDRLGRISAGMSPADIAQAVNLATLRAASDEVDRVGQKHLVDAIDEVLWQGEALELPMLEDVRWRTAVHEAGHALLAWRGGQEIERVSVRPRNEALGFVRTLSEEGRYGMLPNDVLSQLAMAYGGLAAEQVVFGSHGTGVSGDLSQVRRLVRMAIRHSGMSPELPAGLPGMFEPEASEAQIQKAELLEQTMLSQMRDKAIAWLGEHRSVLEDLARYLVEVREIDGIEAHQWIEARVSSSERLAVQEAGQQEISQAAQSWPAGSGASSTTAMTERNT